MRKLCCFAVSFSAAVFACVYLLPERLWGPAGALCALGALAGVPLKGDRRLRLVLIALGLAAGVAWTGLYGAVFHAGARSLAGTEGRASATVEDWPRETSYGCSVVVRLRTETGERARALFYLNPDEEGQLPALRPGDQLTFTARFRAADTRAGQESDYYYSKGITLLAYERELTGMVRPERLPLRFWPVWLSKGLKDSAAAIFPEGVGGLAVALITGDKSALPGGLYSALRRSGLAHAVAVSGMHVSILASLLTLLLGRYRRRSAVAGIVLLVCFAGVAGNTPSVLRAVFMQSMLLLAPLAGREDDRPTSLAAILMLLLVWNPYAAASLSLQLSFAAVAGIYVLGGRLYRRWSGWCAGKSPGKRLLRAAAATASTTLGALAFTTPLSALYFNTLSLTAPLTNLLTLWAMSAAFVGALAVALLGLVFPAGAALLALPLSLPLEYIRAVAVGLARLPFAAVGADSVYLRLWLLLVYALLLLYLFRPGGTKRLWIPAAACAACLCAALALQTAERTSGELTVSVLDVGQGLSVALRAGGQIALVDCGGTGLNDPGDTAADYVQSLGLSRLDTLVLTHYHKDHAQGVPQLLERLEVGRIYLPDVEPEDPLRREIEALAAAHGVETVFVTENMDLPFGGGLLRLYAPLGDGGANEEGLSLLCTSGDFDALVTGDMNDTVERRLLKYGALPDLELLVAGHHGSKYATSEELLLATRPEYAVISVGYNTYGHPAPETLERLAAAGCEIYRTDWHGAVTVTAG